MKRQELINDESKELIGKLGKDEKKEKVRWKPPYIGHRYFYACQKTSSLFFTPIAACWGYSLCVNAEQLRDGNVFQTLDEAQEFCDKLNNAIKEVI